MNFDHTEEQRTLAQTVRDFTKRDSPVGRARRLRDDPIGYEPAVWEQMGDLGWLAVPFSEEVGGLDCSFVEVALILEQLGKTLVPEPYVPSVVLAGSALVASGTEEQCARWLGPMIEGRTTLAFAHTERGNRFGSRPLDVRAARSGDRFVLTGEKVWVDNGHHADHIVVTAVADEGPALFVVDRTAPGMSVHPVQTFDGRRAATLRLDGVEVGDDAVLGEPGAAEATIDRVLDRGAAAAVAEGVGTCQVMLDLTLSHLKQRVQFGVPIGAFQALQHRAVDMFTEMELLRSVAMGSTVLVDSADAGERARAVSAAKVQLCSGGAFVSRQAVQLHGGIGVTDEHDIGLFFKRTQVLCTRFGDEAHHVARYAADGALFA